MMKRRWVWAAYIAATSDSGRRLMSSHGDTSLSSAGNWGPSKIKSAHNICVHVVPHLGGVLITTSPGRNVNPSQRALSWTIEW